MAEANVCQTFQCGFESHHTHHLGGAFECLTNTGGVPNQAGVPSDARERRFAMKLIAKLLTTLHRKSPRRESRPPEIVGRTIGAKRLWPPSCRGKARHERRRFLPVVRLSNQSGSPATRRD